MISCQAALGRIPQAHWSPCANKLPNIFSRLPDFPLRSYFPAMVLRKERHFANTIISRVL